MSLDTQFTNVINDANMCLDTLESFTKSEIKRCKHFENNTDLIYNINKSMDVFVKGLNRLAYGKTKVEITDTNRDKLCLLTSRVHNLPNDMYTAIKNAPIENDSENERKYNLCGIHNIIVALRDSVYEDFIASDYLHADMASGFKNLEKEIKDFNTDKVYNEKYNRKTISACCHWYWFYNPIDNKWYVSQNPYFDIFVSLASEPCFFGSCMYWYDEHTNKTFLPMSDIDFNSDGNWINGRLVIYDNFCYYIDNDTNDYYITHKNNVYFSCIHDAVKKDSIPIDEIIKVYSYDDEQFIVIRSKDDIFISNEFCAARMVPISSIPSNDEEASTLFYKESKRVPIMSREDVFITMC